MTRLQRPRARSGLIGLLLAASGAGCAPPSVLRDAGGEVRLGRFIPAEAYQAYAEGALAEADGRLGESVARYAEAARLDEDGPEAWTRLGAIHCRQKAFDEGAAALDNALRADATFAPAHREIAGCALGRGDDAGALSASERAMVLDPTDDATYLIRARALEHAGRGHDAARLLAARLLHCRADRRVTEALTELAQRVHDPDVGRMAARCMVDAERPIAALTKAPRSSSSDGTSGVKKVHARVLPSLDSIDAALSADDLKTARHLALRASMTEGELAVRAAALGRIRSARTLASLVADADPSDLSARIALAATADLAFDQELLARAGAATRGDGRAISRLSQLLLAEVLARRVDGASARSFIGDDLSVEESDRLADDVRRRLQRRLAR